MQTTEEIVHRVLCGDIESFAELIRLYQREVWAVVSVMLLNRGQTEDLVQRTFVSAYRHLDRFQPGRDFGLWIKEIARNHVRQELRTRLREGLRLERYQQHLLSEIDDPTDLDRKASLAGALRECLEKLPPDAAETIRMRYEQALDFGRIAVLLGRTIGATRQHLARIRIALRDCIRRGLSQT